MARLRAAQAEKEADLGKSRALSYKYSSLLVDRCFNENERQHLMLLIVTSVSVIRS